MDFTLLWLPLLLSVTGCFTAKIVMMPQFGRSHFIVMEKLGLELKSRGHDVAILVGDHESSHAFGKPNVKIFKVSEEFKTIQKEAMKTLSGGVTNIRKALSSLFSKQQLYCDFFLSDKAMMEEVKTADVLIGDSLYPCSSLVADMLGIPHVVVTMSAIKTPTMVLYGVYSYPSYVPQVNSFRPRDMGLVDRIINLGSYLINNYFVIENYFYTFYGELKAKHKIKPEKSIRETMATVDMILLTMNLVTDHAQPLPPYVREVGNFLPSPPQPLPDELEEFFERSGDDGVIYVSFGSMLDTISDDKVEILNNAFSKVPQKVLWRINLDKYEGTIAPNIKVIKWVPQNDVLGHNKTRVFFTHAGANGMAEAIYHGVPMLCMPFFGDQHDNAQDLKDSGMAEVVSLKTITTEQLTRLLKQLIQNKGYKERVSHASRVLKSSPRSPVEQAAEIIEYVHAVGDLKHLKPRGLDLPFYQLYMLDVLLVLGLVITAVLSVLFMSVKLLINLCCRPSKKAKTS